MRKSFKHKCLNFSEEKFTEKYENLGSQIRKGIYDGVGEESTLLRGQYDDPESGVDPYFSFRHPDAGVDKFERAVLHKKQADSLRSTSTQAAQMAASDVSAATSVEPAAATVPQSNIMQNNE